MKPFIKNRFKRQKPPNQVGFHNEPIENHGKVGKTRSMRKWRSRKSKRRLDKIDLSNSNGY